MRFLSLGLVSVALAGITARAEHPHPHHASILDTSILSQPQLVLQETTHFNDKSASAGWSGAVLGALGVTAMSGLEPRSAVELVARHISTLLARLEPSGLLAQAKVVANGLSRGVTLYVATSFKSSARHGMLRRQPRTPAVLASATVASLFTPTAHAMWESAEMLLPSAQTWNWENVTLDRDHDKCRMGNPFSLLFNCGHVDGVLTATIQGPDGQVKADVTTEDFVRCVRQGGMTLGALYYFHPDPSLAKLEHNTLSIPIIHYRVNPRNWGRIYQYGLKYEMWSTKFDHLVDGYCDFNGYFVRRQKVHCCGG